MQSGFAFTQGDMDELDLADLRRRGECGRPAGGTPVPTASVPVVLHPHAAAMILGVLALLSATP